MSLSIGEKLGHYEIVSLLGKGGMGEVYKARDLLLKREVALKVLPGAFANDPDRMARFQREAEVLASLNHPNIAAIYGVVQSGGSHALVMELVIGESPKGPMAWEEAWKLGVQMASALEYAHEKNVVHRDLKPANVMVTADGVLKLLDFGLAKAMSAPMSGSLDSENSPTLTMGGTVAGTIMGTAGYMAPEQAKGRPLDKRADIWAFGVVLWELLAGERLFRGEDVADTLAQVLTKEVDVTRAPGVARRLLAECLQKDPKLRLRDIGDAPRLIGEVGTPETATVPARDSRWLGIAAGVLLLTTLSVGITHFRETSPPAPLIASSIPPPDGAAFDFNNPDSPPALSPDGKWIVFGARNADGKSPLRLRPLASTTAQILPGTEGATFPFWSPESRFVAFFAGGKLKKIDISGGPALAIADAVSGRGGSWSPEGVILFNPNNNAGPLLKVAASGGTPSPATSNEATKSRSHRFPWFLPDGRHFLFEDLVTNEGVNVLLRIGSLDSQETVALGPSGSDAVYSSGHLLFLREDTLMAQPFDADKRTVQGEAVPVAEGVSHVLNNGRKGVFTVSATGLLVYQTGGASGSQRLTWFDRAGKVIGTLGEPGNFASVELSPDRKSAAVASNDAGSDEDIWVYDIARDLRTRFTFDPAGDRAPIWSPDGSEIVWFRTGKSRILRRSSDGKGSETLLLEDSNITGVHSWSPDGKLLLFDRSFTGRGVWSLPLTPEKPGSSLKPNAFVDTNFAEGQGMFSPDGHWVAYMSNESQQNEVYVVPFPGPGGKRQVSTMGGQNPRWRHDGKEIFYLGMDGKLMAAEVVLKDAAMEVGQIRPLDITVPTSFQIPYDISLDGQRILAITDGERSVSPPLTLVENWTGLLKK